MRIRDWSSDVCSSDLKGSSCHCFAAKRRSLSAGEFAPPFTDSPPFCRKCCHKAMPSCQQADWILPIASGSKGRFMAVGVLASFSDRKSVGQGKRVSVSVDLGGHRIITKKKQKQ